MTSNRNKSGVKLTQLKEKGEVLMPLRKCPYCKGLSNFDLSGQAHGGHLKGWASLDLCQNCKSPTYFTVPSQQDRNTILDQYPKLETNLDEELPEDVKIAFREAIESLNDGNWNACVIMCRRALEETMTDLGAEGKDLFHKIDDLESKRKITPELKDWAHEGRLGWKTGGTWYSREEVG